MPEPFENLQQDPYLHYTELIFIGLMIFSDFQGQLELLLIQVCQGDPNCEAAYAKYWPDVSKTLFGPENQVRLLRTGKRLGLRGRVLDDGSKESGFKYLSLLLVCLTFSDNVIKSCMLLLSSTKWPGTR